MPDVLNSDSTQTNSDRLRASKNLVHYSIAFTTVRYNFPAPEFRKRSRQTMPNPNHNCESDMKDVLNFSQNNPT